MNYRSKAKDDSSSHGQQHRGADSFDCRPERYDTDVLLLNSSKLLGNLCDQEIVQEIVQNMILCD